MTYLLTIDPGMSTGIVLGQFTEATPYERIGRWQIEGGLEQLAWWVMYHFDDDLGWWSFSKENAGFHVTDVVVVCEKFVPLPAPRTFKTQELEPIRIEGALQMALETVVWQRAGAMVLAGGDTPAKRKRASDDVLRRLGLWSTGSQIGMKDANDVNSAQKHAIAYLRSIKHEPTMRFLAEGE